MDNTRRTPMTVGYVTYPACNATNLEDPSGFYDTKEGGSEIWMLLPGLAAPGLSVRSMCITGFYLGITEADCVPTALTPYVVPHSWKDRGMVHHPFPPPIDLAICIGASGMSPFDCERREYWQPQFSDLTPEGKHVFRLMQDLYHAEPGLYFILDT